MRRAAVRNGKLARYGGRQARAAGCLALLCALAACGTTTTGRHAAGYHPSHYYPPPGPPSDPWGPYIHEASARFGVPEQWIRGVMRQESGGQEDVISWAGAVGLMQVMPETYNGLRARYDLGDDPFDPHNNLLAGTAYLREMYDRYGAPGFLAAYNAGPNRLDRYLNNGTPLPEETINYVASIAPRLGPGTAMSGPLAAYAGGGYTTRFASGRTSGGCDPDAAYNPDGPCTPVRTIAVAAITPAPAYAATPAPVFAATSDCDPDAAYDPTHPCRPVHIAPVQVAAAASPAMPTPTPSNCDLDAAYDPTRQCVPVPVIAPTTAVVAEALPPPTWAPAPVAARYAPPQRYAGSPLGPRRPLQERISQPASYMPAPLPGTLQGPPQGGAWGIQVGAFGSLTTAQTAAEKARMAAPDLLGTTKVELPATSPFGNQVAFRARLVGLQSAAEASNACARLSGHGTACITVPPNRTSF